MPVRRFKKGTYNKVFKKRAAKKMARVGDEINVSYFRLRLVLANKEDRLNVNWKWWVDKVPKGSGYSYGTWFYSHYE